MDSVKHDQNKISVTIRNIRPPKMFKKPIPSQNHEGLKHQPILWQTDISEIANTVQKGNRVKWTWHWGWYSRLNHLTGSSSQSPPHSRSWSTLAAQCRWPWCGESSWCDPASWSSLQRRWGPRDRLRPGGRSLEEKIMRIREQKQMLAHN